MCAYLRLVKNTSTKLLLVYTWTMGIGVIFQPDIKVAQPLALFISEWTKLDFEGLYEKFGQFSFRNGHHVSIQTRKLRGTEAPWMDGKYR